MTNGEMTGGITRVKRQDLHPISPHPSIHKKNHEQRCLSHWAREEGPLRWTRQAVQGSRGPASGRKDCGTRVRSPEAVQALADNALWRPDRKAAVTVTR